MRIFYDPSDSDDEVCLPFDSLNKEGTTATELTSYIPTHSSSSGETPSESEEVE